VVNITEVAADVQDDQTELSSRSRERDADQLAMDERVGVLKAEYEAAGKPTDPTQAPYRRYKVSKDERSETKRLIRRAANFHGYDPLYWKDSKPTKAGDVFIKYTLTARKAAALAATQADQPQADSPAADPNADQGGEQPQAPTPENARRGIMGRR
jgi:hypothetical protein